MSSEARPRRTTRAAVKVPVELASVALTSKSCSGAAAPSSNGVVAGRAVSKGKGKRDARSDDGDDTRGADEAVELGEQNGTIAKTTKARGRGKPAKSNSAAEKIYDIDFILTNPKSPLVNLDISDVLNYGTWTALSPESRARLCKLLPPTAFGEQVQDIDEFHPSRRHLQNQPSEPQSTDLQKDGEPMQIDDPSSSRAKADESTLINERSLDPSFFNDPHFESAARTFQDHLYSGWLTSAHRELVNRHLSGVRDGSLHAPWKDDVWERDHPEEDEEKMEANDTMYDPSGSIGIRTERRRGKESKSSDFDPLVRKGFLKEGDIISFRHKFNALGITVEKDALASAIHPKTSALTLTASSGSKPGLPPTLLIPYPNEPSDLSALREMNVSAPAQLITALLDLDGRIPRAQRPRLDTWKALTVWRWATELGSQGMSAEEAALLERGGRECFGTLFYLRGEALDDP